MPSARPARTSPRRSGRDREAATEARRQEREAERLRKQTVNAGVKIARVLVGKLFGRSR